MLVGALVLGAVARAVGREGEAQRAADLAALAGARAMHAAYPRLFEPATVAAGRTPRHLERAEYLALGRAAADQVASANGADDATVAFPDASLLRAGPRARHGRRAPRGRCAGAPGATVSMRAAAEAELAPEGLETVAAGGGYDGPLEHRQGKPMRPDVARAFDRMERAARADGVGLLITSAYRSDAEQAVLWRRHPDPKWVARPGESLHRYGTELDLGPPAAYAWLAANGGRFHFIQRYEHEPWHCGYELNARSRRRHGRRRSRRARASPSSCPPASRRCSTRAAQRWNVSAALLAAQIYAESNFNPFAVSPAGAQGIAQFMPETAAAVGLADPFDAAQAIDAQARLMRDLLRQFASVPLALAAYNAGPAPVAACGCVPPIAETRGYVARILGLLGGAGDASAGVLAVRLVK